MTDAELFPFMDTFRSLTRVFPLRGDEHEIRDMGGSYFKAFRRFPLTAIQAGADAWLTSGKRFPKPAEWIDSIPKRPAPSAEIRALKPEDAREWLRAEGLRWEDVPCGCRECREAGVHEKPLRFVPERTDDGGDRHVQLPQGRIVTAGRWAHGFELARFYEARANFWNRVAELGLMDAVQQKATARLPFEQRLEAIFARAAAQ